jgi:hypothetical protein
VGRRGRRCSHERVQATLVNNVVVTVERPLLKPTEYTNRVGTFAKREKRRVYGAQ